MSETESKGTIFISYAWGGGLEKKEWIRQDIVKSLDWKYSVFWDRDSIGFGESIDHCIAKALSPRPISVFCICDADYLKSAQIVGSGLHRELKLLAGMATADDVKIIPMILEPGCEAHLPEPLAGRTYLNLTTLHGRGESLGETVLAVANGATQSQVNDYLAWQIRKAGLFRQVRAHFQDWPFSLWGNTQTHEVTIRPGSWLLAPQWMWDSKEWGYMLGDENPTYCPAKGRWHWDYFTPSRGMRALGTAVMSAFFPGRISRADQAALQRGGALLAQRFFAMTYKTEPFIFEAKDLIQILMLCEEGMAVLDDLLSPPRPWRAVALNAR